MKCPIVADVGSSSVRAGFAGEKYPSVTFPTVSGLLESKK